MKVKDLLQKLQSLDQEATIYFTGPDCGGYDSTLHHEVELLSASGVVYLVGVGEDDERQISEEMHDQFWELMEGPRTT